MIVKELLNKLDYVNQNLEVRSWIYPENGVDAIHKAPMDEIEVTETAIIFTGTEHIPKPCFRRKTLIEVLNDETIPDDEIVSIGALSNFLWIGKKEDAEKSIKKLSKEVYANEKVYVQDLYLKLLSIADQSIKATNSSEYKAALAVAARQYSNAYIYYSRFVPWLDRKVKRIYKKEALDAGTAIIIDGPEKGKLWFSGDQALEE